MPQSQDFNLVLYRQIGFIRGMGEVHSRLFKRALLSVAAVWMAPDEAVIDATVFGVGARGTQMTSFGRP